MLAALPRAVLARGSRVPCLSNPGSARSSSPPRYTHLPRLQHPDGGAARGLPRLCCLPPRLLRPPSGRCCFGSGVGTPVW